MEEAERDKLLGSTTVTAENRMTAEEISAFLAEPFIGRLATVRPDGYPHLTPVWPVWDGSIMSFALGEHRIHIQNLRRTPKATIIIDEDWRPRTKRYSSGAAAVVMRGEVTILDLESSQEPLSTMFVDHAEKFLDGAEGDTDYWNTESGERYHVCHLRPTTVNSWDFRKFHGAS
jgi:nitroimidazol reductase NimA-like FMN-containing flavoprotein (pyridoxamine 5'-phosphate oxidase superfamily)